jgi:phosphoribosylformylglycinamidine cyclo-ligase
MSSESGLTYSDSGVHIEDAQRALRGVGAAIQATHGDEVVAGVGSFGAIYRLTMDGMNRPALVSSIDGVGTKTKVAAMVGDFSGIGADIVNHCINDILCQGARPLFFLDYFGCSKLETHEFTQVITSAAEACGKAGIPLIGGETAEMPGVYHDGEVDVVGAIVGMVELDQRLPRAGIQSGDKVIGLASSGLHTNGYSLARRALLEVGGLSVRDILPGTETTLAQALLAPHKSYLSSVLPLIMESAGIRAAAHITGGGLYDNIPRVLPANLQAVITRGSWEPLPIFKLIQSTGGISDREMFRAFNMGIGFVLIVKAEDASFVVERLNASGEHAGEIGEIQQGSQEVQIV